MLKYLAILCLVLGIISLHAEENVLAIVGSTRGGSLNKKLLAQAVQAAKEMGAQVTVVDLKDFPMPFYDADFESKEGLPAKAIQLRKLMLQSQVIFIASPEYNASLSGVLKNTLDWMTRDEQGQPSRDAFKGKRFALMSTSPGKIGGARGLAHLRAIIEAIGGTVVPEQIVLPDAYEAFDAQGNLKDPRIKAEVKKMVQQALQSS